MQAILRSLSKQYGPMKAFKDEELFDEIEKITNPTVGEFLRKHVGGTEPLPFKEVLSWAGINYAKESDEMVITAGKFSPGVNENNEIYVASIGSINDFGKKLRIEER